MAVILDETGDELLDELGAYIYDEADDFPTYTTPIQISAIAKTDNLTIVVTAGDGDITITP